MVMNQGCSRFSHGNSLDCKQEVMVLWGFNRLSQSHSWTAEQGKVHAKVYVCKLIWWWHAKVYSCHGKSFMMQVVLSYHGLKLCHGCFVCMMVVRLLVVMKAGLFVAKVAGLVVCSKARWPSSKAKWNQGKFEQRGFLFFWSKHDQEIMNM